jgi:hypothetical protein
MPYDLQKLQHLFCFVPVPVHTPLFRVLAAYDHTSIQLYTQKLQPGHLPRMYILSGHSIWRVSPPAAKKLILYTCTNKATCCESILYMRMVVPMQLPPPQCQQALISHISPPESCTSPIWDLDFNILDNSPRNRL